MRQIASLKLQKMLQTSISLSMQLVGFTMCSQFKSQYTNHQHKSIMMKLNNLHLAISTWPSALTICTDYLHLAICTWLSLLPHLHLFGAIFDHIHMLGTVLNHLYFAIFTWAFVLDYLQVIYISLALPPHLPPSQLLHWTIQCMLPEALCQKCQLP